MDDRRFMTTALELARRAEGRVSPRPPVGAVIVSPAGDIIGEGWTSPKPGPHAEAAALEQAGARARDATAYVTLEPCCRSSVAKPCAQQLIDAGVRRVVAATRDPHPEVFGRGLRMLRLAGITVQTGTLRKPARALVEPFSKWARTGVPFLTLKLAATLDGKIAAPDGTSRWVTGERARAEVHELRARVDAVMVGSMTVVRDDPLLTARLADGTPAQPLRVVIDGSGRTPERARIFNDDAPTLLITNELVDREHSDRWTSSGADVASVAAGEGGVDVRAVMELLAQRGICHVLLEGGPTLAAAFMEHGLVDHLVLYLAPKVIGGDAPGLFTSGVKTLTDAWVMRIEAVRRVGEDVRIDAIPEGKG